MSGHKKETLCLCESCVGTKLNSAVAFLDVYNQQSWGTPKYRLREMEDTDIFRIASKLRLVLSADINKSEKLKTTGGLH